MFSVLESTVLSAVFFSAKGLFKAHPFCPFGVAEDKWLFQTLLPAALPCVFGESPLTKGTTVLTKGVKENQYSYYWTMSSRGWAETEAVPMFPTSLGAEMSGQAGARRSSGQPQLQIFKGTLEPSIFSKECGPYLPPTQWQHSSSSFCSCLFVCVCVRRGFSTIFQKQFESLWEKN